MNPNLFFPTTGEQVSDEVKAACEFCPVVLRCRNYALVNNLHGWWGGTSKRQRAKIKKAMRLRRE